MNNCISCNKETDGKFIRRGKLYCHLGCYNKHHRRSPSAESIALMKKTIEQRWKSFIVSCDICKNEFLIKEYNVEHPKKEKYYCSRKCSNTFSSNFNKEERIIKITDSCKNSEKVMTANKARIKFKDFKQKIRSSRKHSKTPCRKNKKSGNYNATLKICKSCNTEFIGKPFSLYCSQLCVHKDDSRKIGGYRPTAGRGKHGWYKGIWCDSSYELAFLIYHLDHNIKIERCQERFPYTFEGKNYTYNPDFIVNDEIIEIKGFIKAQTIAKINQSPLKIKVLIRKDLAEHFEYVIDKYGKDFIKLYEGNPYKGKDTCLICGKPATGKCCSKSCGGIYSAQKLNGRIK